MNQLISHMMNHIIDSNRILVDNDSTSITTTRIIILFLPTINIPHSYWNSMSLNLMLNIRNKRNIIYIDKIP